MLVGASAAQLSSFQAGSGGWQLGSPAVGNIAGNAELEIIVPYRDNSAQWRLDAFDWHGNRLLGFPYNGGSSPINVSPTLYDINGDGKAEIFFTAGSSIVALAGNGSVLWTRAISFANYVPTAGFHAITNGFYMSPLGLFQQLLPLTAQFYSEVSPPLIADLAGNGTLEMLTAWKIKPDGLLGAQDYNPFINDLFGGSEWGLTGETWSGGVIAVNPRTGADTLTYHFHQLVESGLAAGQADEDAAREVYVLNDADSVAAFDRTQPHGLHGKGMLHKMFGKNQRLLSGSYLKGVDIYAADIDGDGRDEVLVASSQIDPNWQPSETILDDDGAILWRKWLSATSFPETYGWFNSACMIPVNPDHDNQIDVLSFTHSTTISFRTWNGVELVDRPGWPKDFAPRLPSPPVVGDIDGDGQEEIIIGTYDPSANPSGGNLHIFSLNGTEKSVLAVPGGLKHIPSIADVNNDGSIDLVYRALDGKIYVQNFGAKPGASVSWATHRGNAQRDGRLGADLFLAGTPRVKSKAGGFNTHQFAWEDAPGFTPQGYRIFADGASIADLPATAHGFTNISPFGTQKIYEVGAIYSTGVVRSAPFAITALLNNNLIANGGFEENDNSHWDKWFSGDIPWERMTVVSNAAAASGRQAMEIRLQNDGSQSSITQYSHYGVPESYLKTVPGRLYSFGGWMRSGGLSASSEHWFEWDSLPTGENPSGRPPLPWPVYFTPSLVVGANATSAWTYLNRVFTMPSGFPNVQLRHRFSVSVAASGSVFLDNVFFRSLPATNDAQWTDLISFGSTWQWTTNTPPANWTEGAALNWPSAPAKFGAGSGPTGIRTAVPARKPAYYFRRSFNLAATNFTELILAATCTDDYAGVVSPLRLFVNGRELTSSAEAVTGEGNLVKYFDLTPFADRFVVGSNYFGVVVQNTWASDWDNVAFDVALKAISQASPAPKFTSVERLADSSISLTMEGPVNSDWRLESSENLSTWQLVATVHFSSASETVVDTGQNDRAHAATVPDRFYRLRSL